MLNFIRVEKSTSVLLLNKKHSLSMGDFTSLVVKEYSILGDRIIQFCVRYTMRVLQPAVGKQQHTSTSN